MTLGNNRAGAEVSVYNCIIWLLQGMTKAAGSVEDGPSGIRLWVHEVLRVFYDRLVDEPDRLLVGRLLEQLTEKHFKEKIGRLLGMTTTAGGAAGVEDDELLGGLRGLIFGDFMVPGAGECLSSNTLSHIVSVVLVPHVHCEVFKSELQYNEAHVWVSTPASL